MPNKVRIFISSTMDDLQNERQLVVKKLRDFGMEPVFAEELNPNGFNSWDLIKEEIQECHLFVLILGSSYGWVPDSGYGGGGKKSVTHLEFDLAKQLELPILTFIKKLKFNTGIDVPRDNFRREVSEWSGGHFRAEFELASDLSEKVGDSVISFLTQSVLKNLVRVRDRAVNRETNRDQSRISKYLSEKEDLALVQEKLTSSNHDWVLIAGAGLSIAAGYPNARLVVASLTRSLWPKMSADDAFGRYSFEEITAFYERKNGRALLISTVKDLLDTPQHIRPTTAHYEAVKKFNFIITTNYDELFEIACFSTGIPFVVSTPSKPEKPQAGKLFIVKLSGTISDVSGLMLTSDDLREMVENSECFNQAIDILNARKIVVAGHSLRDSHLVKILDAAKYHGHGIYVRPDLSEIDEILLERFRLDGVSKKADDYFVNFAP